MANVPSYLVDTNILLRLSKEDDPYYALVQGCPHKKPCRTGIHTPEHRGILERVYTPASHNGFGLSVEETEARVRAIERMMTLLPDTKQIYWA